MGSTRRGSGKKGRRRQAAGRAQAKAGSYGTVPLGPPSQAEFGITSSHGAADSGTVLVRLLISWEMPQTGENNATGTRAGQEAYGTPKGQVSNWITSKSPSNSGNWN